MKNFQDIARQILSSQGLLQTTSTFHSDPLHQLIDQVNRELGNHDLGSIPEFVYEYQGDYTVLFGYLFEPYFATPNINPAARKTRKELSPYFCAKIPVTYLGNIFLIPQTTSSGLPFALVLKPTRHLRLAQQVQGLVIEPTQVQVLYPPYQGLFYSLTCWAVAYQASLLLK